MNGITIEDIPAIQFETVPKAHRTPRKARAPKIDTFTARAIEAYKDAYKAVFRVPPTITVEGKWIRVHGYDTRVSRKRLVEMAKQLRYRAGAV